jgi:hypothetical protein
MQLVVSPSGQVRCRYAEAIDLSALGELAIRRASHVEPDRDGRWWADLAPVGGPRLGPFVLRSDALQAEAGWIDEFLLALPPAVTVPSSVLTNSTDDRPEPEQG